MKAVKPDQLLARCWDDYRQMNPQADEIHGLLGDPVNDHIALRTFAAEVCNIEKVAREFVECGYEPRGEYEFPDKQLTAVHYELAGHPKIFISQLHMQHPTIERITSSLDQSDLLTGGRSWTLTRAEYNNLAAVSEYAGWLAAFGFRVNHFTVDLDSLDFATLEELNQFLKDNGFSLSVAGGEIKGSPDALLEQSSTLAAPVTIELDDGPLTIPGCYYEFIRRYIDERGNRFEAFLAANASKLFESTNRR